MAFSRPKLTDLVDRIQQDIVSRLALTAPILRRSLVYVFSRVMAGAVHMLHGHLEFLAKQVLPDQSDEDYLLRQASLFGLSLKHAEFANGNVVCAGTPGASIIIGSTKFQRSDGTIYVPTDTVLVGAGGTVTVPVGAELAGGAGNCDAGVVLTLVSPQAGVAATATVASGGLTNGSDQETVDSLRGRLIDRLQAPPHGGSAADYIAWAKAVPGVTRAWVYPLEGGAGTVTVRFVRDGDASLIPDTGEVAAVQVYIDNVRPVTATVTVSAPVADVANYTLHISPDNAASRAAVEAELKAMLLRDAKPGGAILKSQISVAIGNTEGINDFTITSPDSDVTHATGHIAVHGTITWA